MALLWSLLNGTLLLAFLYATWRVLVLLRRALGLGLTFVFALGLLSSRSGQSTSEGPKNLLLPDPTHRPLGNWQTFARQPLGQLVKLELILQAQRTDSTIRPTGLFVSVAGLTLGHRWQPLDGLVNVQGHELTYQVFLLHEWRLLNWPVYTTAEEYRGRCRWR